MPRKTRRQAQTRVSPCHKSRSRKFVLSILHGLAIDGSESCHRLMGNCWRANGWLVLLESLPPGHKTSIAIPATQPCDRRAFTEASRKKTIVENLGHGNKSSVSAKWDGIEELSLLVLAYWKVWLCRKGSRVQHLLAGEEVPNLFPFPLSPDPTPSVSLRLRPEKRRSIEQYATRM